MTSTGVSLVIDVKRATSQALSRGCETSLTVFVGCATQPEIRRMRALRVLVVTIVPRFITAGLQLNLYFVYSPNSLCFSSPMREGGVLGTRRSLAVWGFCWRSVSHWLVLWAIGNDWHEFARHISVCLDDILRRILRALFDS